MPTQSVVGVKVTTPVVVLTVYTPPVTDTVVAVQFGAVWLLPHKRTDDGAKEPVPGVSFVTTTFDCWVLTKSDEVSGVAVDAGVTVGVIVAVRLRGDVYESVTWY